MNPSGIQLTLLIGHFLPTPGPTWLTESLASATVTHNDSGPSTFQLQFNADRPNPMAAPDHPLLLEQWVAIGNRVILIVTMDSVPWTLIDGFITHQELSHSRESGMSSISVTGEDVGIHMELDELQFSYPTFGDATLVETLLLKYSLLGIVPIVIPTLTDDVTIPLEWTPQQNESDRAYINKLAQKHGYVFLIRPGLVPGVNLAYWGPPIRISPPQPAFTVDMGAATNVESISFSYDGLAPATYTGLAFDEELEEIVPVATFFSTRFPLAVAPALLFQQTQLFVRNKLYTDVRWDTTEALAFAQAQTDLSTDKVITGNGTLDALRYNWILQAPGLVGVRGAGLSYDGLYYVSSVTHTISRGSYKQNFQISREGLISTVPVVVP